MRRSQFIHPLSLHSMPQVTCLALVAWSMNTFTLLAIGEKVLANSTCYSSMLFMMMWKVMMSQHPIMGSLVLSLPEHIFSFHSLTMGWNTVCWCTDSLTWKICPVMSLGCILLSWTIFLLVSLSQPWLILTLSSEPHTSCLFSLITPFVEVSTSWADAWFLYWVLHKPIYQSSCLQGSDLVYFPNHLHYTFIYFVYL